MNEIDRVKVVRVNLLPPYVSALMVVHQFNSNDRNSNSVTNKESKRPIHICEQDLVFNPFVQINPQNTTLEHNHNSKTVFSPRTKIKTAEQYTRQV